MDPRQPDVFVLPLAATPEALLDALRAHPEWSERQRDSVLDQLIARFPAEPLRTALRPRLRDLSGADAEPVLRLIEAYATPDLLRALAEALVAQPDLAPERAWHALALLEGVGVLSAYPELAERWEELNEALDEEGSLEQLAEQLERDPDAAWVALQGLGAVEPDIRAEIVAALARVPLGPGLINFLRFLAYAHDPATRSAALDILEHHSREDPRLVLAWSSIAEHPPAPEIAERARRWLGPRNELKVVGRGEIDRPSPHLARSLVTALDGRGQGTIVLSAQSGASRVTAAFLCDIERGIREVFGQSDRDDEVADVAFDEFAAQAESDRVEGVPEPALRLLAGSLLLCGPETSPALRYWLEGTVGPGFHPRPFPTPFPGWDPASLPFHEMPERANAVLMSCPTWLDVSELTYELAEELRLRYPNAPPDPRRDAGAYRYLFEHRLVGRLEFFRRMLFWMALFWQASGDPELGRSALALAWQLSDAQHAVPSHPFTVALTTRSLAVAQENLRRGIDPRRKPLDSL